MKKVHIASLASGILFFAVLVVATPAIASAAFVDIKLNGQDGTGNHTVTVPQGSTVNLTWTSSGVGYCNTGNSPENIYNYNDASWKEYVVKPTSGSATYTANSPVMGWGIQCSETQGGPMIVQDWVNIVWQSVPPTQPGTMNVCTSGQVGGSIVSPYRVTCNTPYSQFCNPGITQQINMGTAGSITASIRIPNQGEVVDGVATSACSSTRVHVYIDGSPVATTTWLGWQNDPQGRPMTATLFSNLPLSAGNHTIKLVHEGTPSGCNSGYVVAGAAVLTVNTSTCAQTPTSACSSSSQCGTSGITGSPFCQGNSIYQNYTNYTCNNPGTAQAYCSQSTSAQQQQICNGNQTCSNGTCSTIQSACNSNSQCGTSGVNGSPFCQGNAVYVNYTQYTCNNPGTAQAYCSQSSQAQQSQACLGNQICSNGTCTAQAACNSNNDCGVSGVTGSPYCQGNSIYKNYTQYTCNNPGTSQAYCSQSSQSQLQQTCTGNQTCSNGTCNQVQSACNSNQDCGVSGPTGSNFCQGNSVYKNYTTYTCNSPGTAYAYCSQNSQAQLQNTCTGNQTCSNGTCNQVQSACNSNNDCGISGVTGAAYCQGNSIYRSSVTYTCNNPGTANAFCSNQTQQQVQQTCTGNQTCSNGTCNQIQSACSTNTDCGVSGPTGAPFCQGNSIYKNFTTYTCNNPGTAQAYCTNSTASQVQQTCAGNQTCSNGTCNQIISACNNNNDCGVSGPTGAPFCQGNSVYKNYTTYTCNSPGTAYAYCSQNSSAQVQNTCTGNQTCSSGSCAAVACSTNSDCGVSAATGSPFCQGNNIYKNYTTYTCNSPGTVNAYCTNTTTAQVQSVCTGGQACSNGTCAQVTCSTNSDCGVSGFTGSNFCQGNSVYRNYTTYTCNNPGTINSTCTNSTVAQSAQTCTGNQACSNGSCAAVTCSTNSDCGVSGPTGSNFCQGNSVYKNVITYTCNNPGTVNSTCTNSTAAQVQTTCTGNQACSNGSCAAVACSTNSDCGTSAFSGSPFCQGNSVYKNYTTYTCNSPGTVNAYCTQNTAAQQQSTCTGNQTCGNGTCTTVACSSNSDCGTNAATGSPFCQGNSVYKNYITYTCNNPGTAQAACTNATVAQIQNTCTGSQTCSNGSCAAVVCSTNSDCGTNAYTGSNFCQGNAVYKNYIIYTCNNPGTANATCSNSTQAQQQQTCTGNQTCANGSCAAVTCTNNSDCGTNSITGSPFCQGNSVYQNYRTYTCNNAGTSSSYCSNTTQAQVSQTCSGNQTCSNGSCTNTTPTCTSHSYQQCQGNAVYWYNSCGQSEGVSQVCANNQTCSNNTCVTTQQSLTVTKEARNLSSGNLTWYGYISAVYGDIVQFKVTVYAPTVQNNVVIRDVLPPGIIYDNQLTLNGIPNSGNIISGMNIGSMAAGQTVTITYQTKVLSNGYSN